MRAAAKRTDSKPGLTERAGEATYWVTVSLLVVVPLAFSTAVYRIYSLPKFALLLTGSALLVPLLVWTRMRRSNSEHGSWGSLGSRQVLLVALFTFVILISTTFGVSPLANLFGSSYNQMGLLTHICYAIVFVSLIAVAGSECRFRRVLWALILTGLIVATYAFMQFFGKDLFAQSKFYTFGSDVSSLLRVNSTLGHADYLGNFLLYIAPLAAGLGLASRGHARRVGLGAAGLSVIAIVFTGTRGAWLGLVVSVLVFIVLAKARGEAKLSGSQRRKIIRWAAAFGAGALIFAGVVALSPASRSIALRARSLVKEDTGAGRTVLWRDSMPMVKDYPLIGCGPEGFRKAFLAYKSIELARLAPETNNESSHSSYIDAALSYGLPGAALYAAIIASSFSLFIGAQRRTREQGLRLVIAGLTSSLAAVVVHNFFIFDQISTGLYFFVFAALAQITSDSVKKETSHSEHRVASAASRLESASLKSGNAVGRLLAPACLVGGVIIFFVAAWYSIEIVRADIAINTAVASARSGDLNGVVDYGDRAISHPDPTGDYSFLLARSFALCADFKAAGNDKSERNNLSEIQRAAGLGMMHAEKSLAHTLTPDSSYLLLAYLSLRLGDGEKLFTFANAAVRTDPNFAEAHWLMAEAHLARDQRKNAASEARLALFLNPGLAESRSVLKRARRMPESSDKATELISYARSLIDEGNLDKARRFLIRAIRRSRGPCPECHSALATLYEGMGSYADAISEWEAYQRESPEQAAAEDTSGRIERLRRESGEHR